MSDKLNNMSDKKQQTAVEWLVNRWKKLQSEEAKMSWSQIIQITELAKELEKEKTIKAKGSGMSEKPTDHIVDTNKMISSKTKISDESWEGCDGCTEQDEVMYKNGYVKGYNAAISELPKELSDEEITKLAIEHILYNKSKRQWVIEGMKLYREQLKNK